MLLRPWMSRKLPQSTAIPSPCSSQRLNLADPRRVVRPHNIFEPWQEKTLQPCKQDSATTRHGRRQDAVTDRWNIRQPAANFGAHNALISSLPPSLLLDGDPADIRVDWVD